MEILDSYEISDLNIFFLVVSFFSERALFKAINKGVHKPLINNLPRSNLRTKAITIKRDLSVVETGVGGGGAVGGGGIGGGVDSTGGGAGNVGDTGVGVGGIGGGAGGRDIKTPYTLGKYSTDGGGSSGVIGVDGDGGGIGVGHDIRTPYTLGKYSIVGVGTSKVNS
ncbi:acanthoscurrin-2-like [Solanum tuberosum]|uniref:acanthoscurrin-2-like n=1 Tax=Solanum tuberosum TaxID=4113 RepID=UPI000739F9E8|nr:PREDICTED: acanthoscurrin-2-like [Solanum tuberosum]